MERCSILLVDNCIHIYSPFLHQCRNELRPHEFNVTICVHSHSILILVLNKVWPMMPFRLMAHHTENQVQQARVIFNPFTDIFTKCFSFYFIVISLPLQDLNFVRKELKVIMEDPQNWCSPTVIFLSEMACWFSGGFFKAFSQILNILRNFGWTMSTTVAFVGICHTFCLPKFGHQMFDCSSNRYIVPAKISPALSLCQKNWFCGKVRLDYFYPLLRSMVFSWIHIGIKRISQACCLHHLKNMEKTLKHNFGIKNKIRRFFWATPCITKFGFPFPVGGDFTRNFTF